MNTYEHTYPSSLARITLLTSQKTRGILLSLFAILSFLFFFKSYPARPETSSDPSRAYVGRGAPRVAKVSMLYGDSNFIYERALRSHRWHNEKHNYPFHVLRQEIAGGYWNKPSYILSLVVNELAKPAGERAEWLMYAPIHDCSPLSVSNESVRSS